MPQFSPAPSTRPYLIRAIYEWCIDHSLTPYVAAYVDDQVRVPMEFVKNNEIVLNISMDATSNLKIDNEWIQFKARFGGVAREIFVPITHVMAVYARENGQGMAFPGPQISQPAPLAPTQDHSPAAQAVDAALKETVVPLKASSIGQKKNASLQSVPTASVPIAPIPSPPPGASDKNDPPPSKPRPTLTRIK